MKRTPLSRKKPINSVGRRVARERKAMADAYQEVDHRSHGYCEADVAGVCEALGLEHHHVGPRSTHPHLRTDPTNIILVCRPCHIWIGANPHAATELGLHLRAST